MAQQFETLIDVFHSSIEKFGPRPLFGTKTNGTWVWTTYKEFGDAVDKFRAGLAKAGVVNGDRVAAISNNRVEWAVAEYACFGLGAAFVPMYEAQSEKDWDFIVKDAGAKVRSRMGGLNVAASLRTRASPCSAAGRREDGRHGRAAGAQ